jgi:acyl-CoA synthetase (AMP-forming)/AMP-acid ligase II
MNVVDPIIHRCRWQPLALALCAPGTIFGAVTYDRLAEMIHNIGRHAGEHGLARGQIVVLLIKDPILHVAFILGLTKRDRDAAVSCTFHAPERSEILCDIAARPRSSLPLASSFAVY